MKFMTATMKAARMLMQRRTRKRTSYKEEYVYNWVLSHLGDGHSLIELASGIGFAAGWLRERRPDLQITGCDFSDRAAEDFIAMHDRPCFVADLTRPFDIDGTFDTVIVMGGIHHLIADLDTAFANISNLLNKGGRFIMAEPNADYMLEPLRRLWYRADKSNFDAENERALSHDTLLKNHGNGFRPVGLTYFGGPAYYLMGLNWVLRMPNASKRWMAPALMRAERIYHKLPGRLAYASFISCWEKY